MIEKGKIPMATVSFNLKHPEEGPFARFRTPFYDLAIGDIVVVNRAACAEPGKQALAFARVTGVDWIKPPYNYFYSPDCILTYLNIERLLKDSIESQKEAYEEAVRYADRSQQRKKEIEATVRELQEEIIELIKELDRL